MTSMYAAAKISLISFQAVLRVSCLQLWLYVANISTEFLSVWLQFVSGECGPSPIIGVGRKLQVVRPSMHVLTVQAIG